MSFLKIASDSQFLIQFYWNSQDLFKGTVKRKLMGVKSFINVKGFLCIEPLIFSF
jgi:hypothetical protein